MYELLVLLPLGGVANEPLLDTLHELLQEHVVGQVTGPLLVCSRRTAWPDAA